MSNWFDLSHDKKLSLNMGELVPVLCAPVIPGDNWKLKNECFLRLAPMVAPIMHKVDVYTHTFFVPNRIVWPGWDEFITGGENGSLPGPAFPFLVNVPITEGSLGDYLGLPIEAVNGLDKISALPFACYQMCFNEYYRDQNLQDPVEFLLVDGNNSPAFTHQLSPLRKRAWEHDLFTASLPFAQKGEPVDIPLNGYMPVVWNSFGTSNTDTHWNVSGTGQPSGSVYLGSADVKDLGDTVAGNLYADGSQATGGTTINELRKAFRLQEWFEKNARGGSRYIETILVHFGVRSSDSRLNRPEWIGGTKQNMIISEVLQNSQSEDTPQGNMSGHGVSVGNGYVGNYYAEEHGYILTIMSILPKTAYQQGIPKHFSVFDKIDFPWPTFAHLGEEGVLNREIFYDHADGDVNDEIFGYLPRYYDHRQILSSVAGDFRSTLSYWHMGRIFPSRPALNAEFIESDPTHRIFAVTDPDVDKVYAHVYHNIKCSRKLPKYGTPTF